MALPALLRKLFKSSGYGSELNDDLISRNIFIREWVNTYDYDAGVLVRGSDGQIYMSVVVSGPGTSAGAKDPTTAGASYWVAPKIPTAGASENSNVAASTAFVKTAISSAVASAVADAIPTGSIVYYGKSTVPSGWLVCNGAAVSRTTYAALFGVIGTTFGAGNGSSTFNVPNLIDRFPEGNATPGTVKAAGLPNITGKTQFRRADAGRLNLIANYPSTSTSSGAFKVTATAGDKWVAATNTSDNNNKNCDTFEINASLSSSIYGKSTTVQPPALTLVPCIRYV